MGEKKSFLKKIVQNLEKMRKWPNSAWITDTYLSPYNTCSSHNLQKDI